MDKPEFEETIEETKRELLRIIDNYIEELERKARSPDNFPTIDQIEKLGEI